MSTTSTDDAKRMDSRAPWLAAAAVLASLLVPTAEAAGSLGPTALRARYPDVAPQLAASPFGGALVLHSQDVARAIDGDVYAVVDRPFAELARALGDPSRWCDILILHLNTKQCRAEEAGTTHVQLRVGKKEPQPPGAAALLSFRWSAPTLAADYLGVQMDSPAGPYGTRNYAMFAEAVPLDAQRSFLHMGYGFMYGAASELALEVYLGTVGRERVGFTREQGAAGNEHLVGGMRGVAERNTMRYYLAIQAYLSAPGESQVEQRLGAWFDATEKYSRQLHELDRDSYLRMKRDEVRQQAEAR